MITVQNLSVAFGSQTLFEEVDVEFTPGNVQERRLPGAVAPMT